MFLTFSGPKTKTLKTEISLDRITSSFNWTREREKVKVDLIHPVSRLLGDTDRRC